MSNISEYILVIPSWYPSKVDIYNGDFNQRFVNAVSKHHKQVVLYVIADSNLKEVKIEETEVFNIITIIVYYPLSGNKLFQKFYKAYQYLMISYKAIKSIIKQYGKPQLIHSYVFFPVGIIAILLKYRFKVPSILTEHWTAFYKEDPGYLKNHSFLTKLIYKRILNSFDLILPVAKRLETAIKEWTINKNMIVIPNLVNTNIFFYPGQVKNEEFTFIHVSTMGYQKNTEGILNVLENILIKNINVKLLLIGPLNVQLKEIIDKSKYLKLAVNYIGEVEYSEVAYWMKRSDAFILFSRYENLPCVILEALCCGLPIISTDVGGIAEVINKSNGLLVDSEDIQALESSMIKMLESNAYEREGISDDAVSSYGYDIISEKISLIYNNKIKNC